MKAATMPRTTLAVLLAVSALLAPATAPAQDASAMSPLMAQINGGKWLDPAEAEQQRADLYYQTAIQAYLRTLPALNVIGMRDGSEAVFGAGYNVLPIWKERMDSRTWVPTPNADVIYSMSYLDLKETGPLVVAAPPNVIGGPLLGGDRLQHHRRHHGRGAAAPALYQRLQPGGEEPGRLHRPLVRAGKARGAGGELDPDGARPQLPRYDPPLRHGNGLLRSDLEAGRRRESTLMGAIPS